MVRGKSNRVPDVRSTYYLRPGQTLENTKPSERVLALVVSNSELERFKDYARESERVAILAEREAKRIAALKAAARDMTKTWEDTTANIEKRRREELLSRKKLEETQRIELLKELAAKNSRYRAQVLKDAKELILYRKPQVRLINGALARSECLKELDAQIEFNKAHRIVREKMKEEDAKRILQDVENFRKEEAEKRKKVMKKIEIHTKLLNQQVEENKEELKKIKEEILRAELQDIEMIEKEITAEKERELQEAIKKKEALKKMFTEAIEIKREYQKQLEELEELRDENLKIYNARKQDIKKTLKEKELKKKQSRACREEMLVAELAKIKEIAGSLDEAAEEQREATRRKLEEEQDKLALARIEREKEKKSEERRELLERMKLDEENREKREKEKRDLQLWEILQRYKRAEFNRDWEKRKLEEKRKGKILYRDVLKQQMEEKQKEREKAKAEEDDSAIVKQILESANEKVLAYGEKVLKESEGVRPLFPIVQAIEGFKREVGLVPTKSQDVEEPPKARIRKRQLAIRKEPDDKDAFQIG